MICFVFPALLSTISFVWFLMVSRTLTSCDNSFFFNSMSDKRSLLVSVESSFWFFTRWKRLEMSAGKGASVTSCGNKVAVRDGFPLFVAEFAGILWDRTIWLLELLEGTACHDADELDWCGCVDIVRERRMLVKDGMGIEIEIRIQMGKGMGTWQEKKKKSSSEVRRENIKDR